MPGHRSSCLFFELPAHAVRRASGYGNEGVALLAVEEMPVSFFSGDEKVSLSALGPAEDRNLLDHTLFL